MQRGHAMMAVLVALAGLWAYMATHPGPGGKAGGPAARLWDVPLRSVESLTLHDGKAQVVLRPQWETGADTPYLWIELPAPEGGQQAPPPDGGQATAFKGNAAALETLRHFAALPAQRDLGPIAALDGAEFGLPAPEAYLELTRGDGSPLRLQLGRASYGQTGRYALLEGPQRVYLLGTAELRRLAGARGNLMDRELLDLPAEATARVELSAGGAARLFHRLESAGEPGQWAAAPDASEGLPDVAVVVTALQRMKVVRYPGEEEPGATLPTAPALEVRFHTAGSGEAAGEPVAWVRLYPPDGQTAQAQSSYTRRPVLLPAPAVQQVLEKVRALLKGT